MLRLGAVAGTWDAQPWGDPLDDHVHAATLASAAPYPRRRSPSPAGRAPCAAPAYPYLLGAVVRGRGREGQRGAARRRAAGDALGRRSLYLIALRLFDRRAALWAAARGGVPAARLAQRVAAQREPLRPARARRRLLLLLELRARPRARTAAAAGVLLALAALTALERSAAPRRGARRRRPAAPPVAGPALRRGVRDHARALDAPQRGRARRAAPARDAGRLHDGRAVERGGGARRSTSRPPGASRRRCPAFADLFRKPGSTRPTVDAELRSRALDFAADEPGHVVTATGLNALRIFEAGPGHDFVVGDRPPRGRHRRAVAPGRADLDPTCSSSPRPSARGGCGGGRDRSWVWLFRVLLLAAVIPLLGSPRYRAPVDPFLILLAVGGLGGALARRPAPGEARGAEARTHACSSPP